MHSLTFQDPLYLKMEERWFIVERLEEDWIFYFWCSENQAAADAGVVVLGRQRFVEQSHELLSDQCGHLNPDIFCGT